MVMIVYATRKLYSFYLLVPLLLIFLFMTVYDGGSKYLLLLATKRDSVPAGLGKTVPHSMAMGACGESQKCRRNCVGRAKWISGFRYRI